MNHFYCKYGKRIFDVIGSLLAMVCFSWLYVLIALLVRIHLGPPVLFRQPRPGKDERVFLMYKFRSMSEERDDKGDLLPDDKRLGRFGKWLRSTSLDELPEVFNILKGDMSIIGPRPQLVRDLVFMTKKQRMRHRVRPGLSGLAQINGRNGISWEEKLKWDLRYIKRITFLGDLKILFLTVWRAFVKREGITMGSMDTAMDYGDVLLLEGKVSREEYERKQQEARRWMERNYG